MFSWGLQNSLKNAKIVKKAKKAKKAKIVVVVVVVVLVVVVVVVVVVVPSGLVRAPCAVEHFKFNHFYSIA